MAPPPTRPPEEAAGAFLRVGLKHFDPRLELLDPLIGPLQRLGLGRRRSPSEDKARRAGGELPEIASSGALLIAKWPAALWARLALSCYVAKGFPDLVSRAVFGVSRPLNEPEMNAPHE